MKKNIIRINETDLKNIVKESVELAINEAYLNSSAKQNTEKPYLTEMARIDEPSKDSAILGTKEIWVYGNDRSSMTPHFHYFDKKNKPFHVEVKIDNLEICHSAPRAGIPENKLNTWTGLSNELKALKKWLESNNGDIPEISNYQALKLAWNQNNRSNPE